MAKRRLSGAQASAKLLLGGAHRRTAPSCGTVMRALLDGENLDAGVYSFSYGIQLRCRGPRQAEGGRFCCFGTAK